MDISYPISDDNNGQLSVSSDTIPQERIYSQLATVRGERPLRPSYGVSQSIFLQPGDMPDNVEDVLISMMELNDGQLTYYVNNPSRPAQILDMRTYGKSNGIRAND